MNGDGVVDVLKKVNTTTSSGAWELYFGLGDGSFSAQAIPFSVPTDFAGLPAPAYFSLNLQIQDGDHDRGLRDMDGDGLPDWVVGVTSGGSGGSASFYVYKQGQGTDSPRPGFLLEAVTTENGATFEYAYMSSNEVSGLSATTKGEAYTVEVLPSSVLPHRAPTWLLAGQTVSDGLTGTAAQSTFYDYAELRYDQLDHEFLGARMREDIDASGTVTRSIFRQLPSLRSRVAYQEVVKVNEQGGEVAALSGSKTTWTEVAGPAGSTLAEPTELRTWTEDPANGKRLQRTVVQHLEPLYARVKDERDYGPNDTPQDADDLLTTFDYSENTTRWLVNYPKRRTQCTLSGSSCATASGAAGTLLSKEEFVYHTDPSQIDAAPTDGLLRHHKISADFLSTPQVLHTSRMYDFDLPAPVTEPGEPPALDVGNLMAVRTPVHLATQPAAQHPSVRIDYETQYNSFPKKIQRYLNSTTIHETQLATVAKTGVIERKLHPNGYLECWTYNDLSELAGHWQHNLPGPQSLWSSCAAALELYEIEFRGTPGWQRLRTQRMVNGSNSFFDYDYFDGLGRVFTEARAHEGTLYSVARREWGERGELVCESLPRHIALAFPEARCSQGPGAARVFEYDELLRPTLTLLIPELGSPMEVPEVQYSYSVVDSSGFPGTREAVEHQTFGGGGASSPDLVRAIGRSARGAVVSVVEGTGGDTGTTYLTRDARDRVKLIDGPDISMTSGGVDQNVIVLEYDTADRRRSLARPRAVGGAVRELWQYQWDQNGNLEREVTSAAQEIRYQYDAFDRLLLEDLEAINTPQSPGPDDYALVYDTPLADSDPNNNSNNKGYLAEVKAPSFTTRYQRSLRGFILVQQAEVDGTTPFGSTFLYDRLGRVTLRVFPDGEGLGYTFSNSALTQVSRSTAAQVDAYLCASPPCSALYGQPILTNIHSHANGRVAQVRHQEPGVDVEWTFDDAEAQRPTLIQATGPSGLIQKLTLSYDPRGNPLAILDEARVQPRLRTFSYDSRHRLAGFTDSHPRGFPAGGTFQYDPAGNRLNSGAIPLGYGGSTYPPDAMSLFGASAAAYDAQGNRTTRLDSFFSTTTGAWSDDNRLTTLNAGGARTMRYDFDGRRTRVTGSGANRAYLDSEYESDLQALTHTKHVLLEGRKAISLSQDGIGSDTSPGSGAPGQRVHLFQDQLGSTDVAMAWDGDPGHAYGGQVYFYEPWGQFQLTDLPASQSLSLSAASTRYQFTGYERDDSALANPLYYAGARHYDSRSGRFLSEDPALLGASGLVSVEASPQLQNAYAYALNRPTALVDPSGRLPIEGGAASQGFSSIWGFEFELPSSFFDTTDYTLGAFTATSGRSQGTRPDLGTIGNTIREQVDSPFEKDLFENYWLGKGEYRLTEPQFEAVTGYVSGQRPILSEQVAIGGEVLERRTFSSFYRSTEYNAAFGTASVFYRGSRPVGFYDRYNFDVDFARRDLSANLKALGVQIGGALAGRGSPFDVTYGIY